MDTIANHIDAWVVALLFGAVMFAAWAIGLRSGRRRSSKNDAEPGTKLVDATLALLGLLLAFTFAMAVGRHDQRRLVVVAESNALGDFYTCATLLQEPERSHLQAAIREYAQLELGILREYPSEDERLRAIARSVELANTMTELVRSAVNRSTPIAVNLTGTLNGLTSATAARVAAYEDVLPWNTEAMLLATCGVALFLIGRHQGASQERSLTGTYAFIALVTLVIFVVLDLNQPRRGLIRVNIECLERLVASMGK